MAAAGSITKSTESTSLYAKTIAPEPSLYVLYVEGRRIQCADVGEAFTAQYNARTFGFEASEVTAVHRLEGAR